MPIVYLALGSNLGDRQKNIASAIILLQKNQIQLLQSSSIIETEPVGGPAQGKFLNSVIKVHTEILPQELLRILQNIEQQLGRIKTVVNGPRTIDLDILLYGDSKINSPELTIPHPRMLERDFVMEPLKEINPSLADGLLYAHHKKH